jgi:hypothetical protein
MTNDMIPASMMGGGAISTRFQGAPVESLGEGIRGGFGIIGYKGKVWSTKFQGNETPLMRDDGDGPRTSIEVVIVKAAPNIAKIFYEQGFVDGSTAPPDCWSTDGVKPDGGASKKQSTTCAGCPKNAWGSKVTEAGKPTKACNDSKRLAVVPLNDLANELMGGPMLLRVPAASLKDLKTYGDQLQGYGFPYFAVATRISFDHTEAFPKFVFTAMRPLTDAEADIILPMRDGPQVSNILNTSIEVAQHEPEAPVPASPFENGAVAKPAAAVVQATAAMAQAQTQVPAQPQVHAAPVQPVQTAQAPAAQPAQPAKTGRTRRTKEEMAAAAAALAAKRNGGAAPAPAAQPAQVVQDPAALAAAAAETAPANDDFEDQLDKLLPA